MITQTDILKKENEISDIRISLNTAQAELQNLYELKAKEEREARLVENQPEV